MCHVTCVGAFLHATTHDPLLQHIIKRFDPTHVCEYPPPHPPSTCSLRWGPMGGPTLTFYDPLSPRKALLAVPIRLREQRQQAKVWFLLDWVIAGVQDNACLSGCGNDRLTVEDNS